MPHVKLFGSLRRYVNEHEFDIPGQSIDDVLKTLCTENAALCAAIFDGDKLRPHVRVMISGRDVELDEGLNTPVGEADDIAIFPPIAGGSGTTAGPNIRP
jgi:molybdopterin synthase sulfur carrier subunit